MIKHTSRFLPSDKTSRILFRLEGSLASSWTSTGWTCVPSITQPSVNSRICFLLGASLVVTIYSFVMPLDGCATSLAHLPVCHSVVSAYHMQGSRGWLLQAQGHQQVKYHTESRRRGRRRRGRRRGGGGRRRRRRQARHDLIQLERDRPQNPQEEHETTCRL